MECDRCRSPIDPGEERQHEGRILCEDCCMDALSPMKSCDPWAVHSAKSFQKHTGDAVQVTPGQSDILRVLKEEGPLPLKDLMERLGEGLTFKDLERDLAVLRHMEKARAQKSQGRLVWRLW